MISISSTKVHGVSIGFLNSISKGSHKWILTNKRMIKPMFSQEIKYKRRKTKQIKKRKTKKKRRKRKRERKKGRIRKKSKTKIKEKQKENTRQKWKEKPKIKKMKNDDLKSVL
jgi:hypothetical protein